MFGHIKRKELDLSKVKMLVIDEADNMILNDEREVRRSASGAARGGRGAANAAAGRTDDNVQSCMNIKNLVPRDCQILLFSATFSKYALKFAENVAPRALHVKLQDEFRPVDNVTQIVIHAASKEEKYNALKEFWQTLDVGNVLIFCRVCEFAAFC